MATEVTKVIDPDNGAGTDYTSLGAWEDALGGTTSGDLPTDDEIAVAQCRASSGGDDTTAVRILGWTTDATRYIQIELHSDESNTGVWNDSNYVLHNNDTDDVMFRINEDYVRVIDIQLQVTTSSANSRLGFQVDNVGTTDIRFDSCLVKGICSGTGAAYGFQINDSTATVKIYNCIVYNFVSGSDTHFIGINVANASNCYIYNCTIYGNYYGIKRVLGTVTATNCAIGNNTDDIDGTVTADYNCDDDNDGTNNQSPSGGDWDNEFTTPGTDFSLESAGNCVGNGTDDPGGGLYSDDIAGNARSTTWDIGAFEYVGAPPAGIPILRRRRECA